MCLPGRLSGWTGSVVSQPGCLARLLGWTDSIVSHCLYIGARLFGRTGSYMSSLVPSFVSRCLPASLDVWHGSVTKRIHLSPFLSLNLAPVVFQPRRHGSLGGRIRFSPQLGCLLSARTGSFAALCVLLVVSQPGCLARLCGWTDSFVSICPRLSPSLDDWHGSLGGRIHLQCVPQARMYV